MRPVLCLVTDRRRMTPDAGKNAQLAAVAASAAAAARAGVGLFQVREPDLEGRDLARLVRMCVEAVHGSRTRVLVNDRLDAAIAAGAHGVHLPGHGVPAERVRAVAPRGFLVGRSVHHATEAVRVVGEGGLDYLIFGTVFATASKEGVAPAGVNGLAAAVAAVPVPVLAIGGITLDRAALVAGTGAAGFAAIGLFAGAASDPDALRAIVAGAERAFDSSGNMGPR